MKYCYARASTEQIDHARKLIDKGEARQYVADLLNVGPLNALRCACQLTKLGCAANRTS
jgi:hypothetical protein